MAEEQTEERLNPELKENDIPYNIKVDPDDQLGDAKKHVRHAESRIHALRARLKKKKSVRDKEKTSIITTRSNKTMAESTSVTTEISTLRSRVLQLEQQLKSKDDVNKKYSLQLSSLSGKDGEIELLERETLNLENRLSETTSLLTISLEKSKDLQSRLEIKSKEISELFKYRLLKTELMESIVKIDNELKLKMDSIEEQKLDMSSKDIDLFRLRELNNELQLKLTEIGKGKDAEISRLRENMQTLQEEIARNSDDLKKMRDDNLKLLDDIDKGKIESQQLLTKLTKKNTNLTLLQVEKKDLETKAAEYAKQSRLVKKIHQQTKEKQEQLDRIKRKHEQLSAEADSLINEISTQKLKFGKKEEAYLDLEEKFSDLQITLAGKSNKEKALLEEMKNRKQQLEDTQRKWQSKVDKDAEVERENEVLKRKYEEAQSTNLKAISDLRREYMERQISEVKMSKENEKVTRELDLATALCAKNVRIYEAFKKMYDEEMAKYGNGQCDESITLSAEQEKIESDMKQKILFLEKLVTTQDQDLAKASETENINAEMLRSANSRFSELENKLSAKDLELEELQKKLAKAKRDEVNGKWSEDQKYQSELLVLRKQIEEWKQKAERNEKNLSKTRSEMEAQIKLMRSKEDMVQARDQQINTLNNAYHLTEAAASKKPSEKMNEQSKNVIYVTSVVDNRYGMSNPGIVYYKHHNPIVMDIHRVSREPVIDLETELETIRRKKLIQEARNRRVHDRRPSLEF